VGDPRVLIGGAAESAPRICTLGDLLLDVIVRLDGELEPGADATAETRTGAGGQAANVAAWAADLGAEARFVGKRGDDAAGELLAAELRGRGVDVLGPAEGRNGVVVSLVAADGDRTMASDRGAAPELRPEELEPAWFDCDWLHVTGYTLLRSPLAEAAARAATMRTGRLSVDLSSWTALRDFGAERFRERLRTLEPDLLFANEQEREVLGELPAPDWVLKRGARGIVVGTSGRTEELDAAPAAVVDATGAGDALAAGFLVGGTELALAAAARCVSKLGAMP
jgi:sugar/nucleoside kinase (ribokinase family)